MSKRRSLPPIKDRKLMSKREIAADKKRIKERKEKQMREEKEKLAQEFKDRKLQAALKLVTEATTPYTYNKVAYKDKADLPERTEVIKAQPGPQTDFLACPADVVVFGGSAGGGKSFSLLMDPLRYVQNENFGAILLRRTYGEIKREGALWDEAIKLYLPLGATPRTSDLSFTFPSGAVISFAHLQHEKDMYSWQGSQVPYIGFDEVTHFCMTPDHEVLTETGWSYICHVKPGERVLSLTKDGKIELQEVKESLKFPYKGNLIEVNQRNGVSMRMTPNHRIPVRSQSSNKKELWRIVEAQALTKTIQQVLRSGVWDSKQERKYFRFTLPKGRGIGSNANVAEKILMDDWLLFLGWYFSEGSSFLASKAQGGTKPCVSIRQTQPNKELAALMNRLPWRVSSDGDGGYKIYSRQLYDVVHVFGNLYKKRVPEYVFTLSKRQQALFFHSFMLGDGYHAKRNNWQVGLANEGLIDDLHEICVYLGLSATKSYIKTKDGFDVWRLNISKRSTTMIRPQDVSEVPYNGNVYCLTVEKNHTFFVRHNGRTHWTGNTERQFWYLASRQRNVAGIPNLMRCTCNPDPDSFIRDLIDWWIDKNGYAIPERSGVIRWFIREGDKLHWAPDRDSLIRRFGEDMLPRSFTFIRSTLQDNQILLDKDPTYLATLKSLPKVDKMRLLDGNWNIRPAAGLYFRRTWFKVINADEVPPLMRVCRGWDLAGTEKEEIRRDKEPAATAGVKIGRDVHGNFYVLDLKYEKVSPLAVERMIKNCATQDGLKCQIRLPQDPGQAGKAQVAHFAKLLAGYTFKTRTMSGDKVTRAGPFSSMCEYGRVFVVRGSWNDTFFNHLEEFPPQIGSPDIVDAAVEAFHQLTVGSTNVKSVAPISVTV